MEVEALVDALEREGQLLADAAEAAGVDAPVPTCPDWTVGDLVRHIGFVHGWAGRYVGEGLTEMVTEPTDEEITANVGPPDDPDLVTWYRAAHSALVATLRAADPDVACWTFLPADSPLGFWARRQAHETGIHRVDAERAAGAPVTPFPADFACDGLDELLGTIHGYVRLDDQRAKGSKDQATIAVRPREIDSGWLIEMEARDPAGDRRQPPGSCSLRGGASDLYVLLSNRAPLSEGDVFPGGDLDLLRRWRETKKMVWA